MSWEIISEKKKTCPCKSGFYTVTLKLDDWNRMEEFWNMNCSHCEDDYILHHDFVTSSGLNEKRYFWIKKSQWLKFENLKSEAKKFRDLSVEIARREYQELWNQYFFKKKKKFIWKALTNNGSVYPSLSTFYTHIKEWGIEQYLSDFFKNYNSLALQILNVENKEISSLREKANSLEEEANNLLETNKISGIR
ncbi:hypothetical protein [Ekhidna sp.]|uniref:hypothetical protein n=1 Tax=Ekhidna sp. TaxID=2608089 RepID=UPI0032980703